MGLTALIPEGGVCQTKISHFANGFHFFAVQALGKTKKVFPRLVQQKKCAPFWKRIFLCREDGIRTHDAVTHIQTFQACSFNHSDTSLSLRVQIT